VDFTSAFFFEDEAKDLMVPVCHYHTPVIDVLANPTTLQ
jgi:hypothetical protein